MLRFGVLFVIGCQASSTPDAAVATPCAVENVTGALPGVALAIASDRCVYRRGDAAVFTYEVRTDASVPALHVPASQGCGRCQKPSTAPSSWIHWSIGGTSTSGVSQNYCLCDTGCCPPDEDSTIQPIAATESGAIEWSGRTWGGPSDTGEPMGEFFAPGNYRVSVTFAGGDTGSVTAELPIVVE